MRSLLALSLLISLCVPAAARVHHHPHWRPNVSHIRPDAVFRPSQNFMLRPEREEVVPPGWYKFPGYPPIPPEENRNLDASNRGSA